MIRINLYDKTRKRLRKLKAPYPLNSTKIEDVVDDMCKIVLQNLEIREDLLKLNSIVYKLCDTEKELVSQVLCNFNKLYVKDTTILVNQE